MICQTYAGFHKQPITSHRINDSEIGSIKYWPVALTIFIFYQSKKYVVIGSINCSPDFGSKNVLKSSTILLDRLIGLANFLILMLTKLYR